MTSTTKTTEALWWSERGTTRCRSHLPLPGSESWWQHGWVVMRPEDRERLERIAGKPVECETCAQHATGAHAEYLAARAKVADAITTLVAHLDELDAREDAHRPDWSFAETLNHVAAALRDLVPSASTREDG